MEQVSATRSELLARRVQIALASQGRDLLKEKRAALMVEFGRLSTGILEAVETLGSRAATSAGALSDAVAFDGPEAVGSAAIAASGDIATRLSASNVAGVSVVELEHDRISRGHAAVTAWSRRPHASTSQLPPSSGNSTCCSMSRPRSSVCGGWPRRSRGRRGASTRSSMSSCRGSSASGPRSRSCSPSGSSRIGSG